MMGLLFGDGPKKPVGLPQRKRHTLLRWANILTRCLIALLLLTPLCIITLGVIPDSQPPTSMHPTLLLNKYTTFTQLCPQAGNSKLIPIHLLDNGVHIDFAIPARHIIRTPAGQASIDYTKLFGLSTPSLPPSISTTFLEQALAECLTSIGRKENITQAPQKAVSLEDWLIVGWGNLEFYIATPEWNNFSWSIAWQAVTGGPGVLHVYHLLGAINQSLIARTLYVNEVEYLALYEYIAKNLVVDKTGKAQPIPNATYGYDDAFFYSKQYFSGLYTCNSWAGDALKAMGRKAPLWTIIPYFILWHVPSSTQP